MRHAKSSWDDDDLSDYQRGLSKRGRSDAHRVSEFLMANNIKIDIAYISSSTRTVQTFSYLKPLRIAKIKILKNHYLANYEFLLKRIKKTENNFKSILLLNHEPACKNLTEYLTKLFLFSKKKFIQSKFSTASIAFLEFNCKRWNQIDRHQAVLTNVISPKNFDHESKE